LLTVVGVLILIPIATAMGPLVLILLGVCVLGSLFKSGR